MKRARRSERHEAKMTKCELDKTRETLKGDDRQMKGTSREDRKETELKVLTKRSEPEYMQVQTPRSWGGGVATAIRSTQEICSQFGRVCITVCVRDGAGEQKKRVTVCAINRLYDFSTLRPPVL